MTDNRCLEKERVGVRVGVTCHFSDQNFLPCFLCKHPTILSQNKNGIFQHIKIRLLIRETSSG